MRNEHYTYTDQTLALYANCFFFNFNCFANFDFSVHTMSNWHSCSFSATWLFGLIVWLNKIMSSRYFHRSNDPWRPTPCGFYPLFAHMWNDVLCWWLTSVPSQLSVNTHSIGSQKVLRRLSHSPSVHTQTKAPSGRCNRGNRINHSLLK
jgi:hypothetical protein